MNKKSLTTRIMLALLATLLFLLALEQGFRVHLFGSASFSHEKMNSVRGLGVSGLVQPSVYSEVVYELKPDLDTCHLIASLKTNADGLRDKDYSREKPAHVFRVAVIGDSFAMPDGLEIEEAFHSRLEEMLSKERGDLEYQFVNFGVSGYTLRQYLGVMRNKAQKYDPDLILVSFCPTNDHTIPSKAKFDRRYRVRPVEHPLFKSRVLEALKRAFGDRGHASAMHISDEQRAYMSRMFEAMNAHSKQHDVPVLVAYLNSRYSDNEEYEVELEELVSGNGLNFVNAGLSLAGMDRKRYWIYATNAHPNAEANQLFADKIFQYFLDRGW